MSPISPLVMFLGLAICHAVVGQPPPMPERMPPVPPKAPLPVGDWEVQFANGVVQKCSIRRDGSASVTEPLRTAEGRAIGEADSVVIRYRDDRTERWTRIGNRVVVEHWCPSSEFPAGAKAVGIGDLLDDTREP